MSLQHRTHKLRWHSVCKLVQWAAVLVILGILWAPLGGSVRMGSNGVRMGTNEFGVLAWLTIRQVYIPPGTGIDITAFDSGHDYSKIDADTYRLIRLHPIRLLVTLVSTVTSCFIVSGIVTQFEMRLVEYYYQRRRCPCCGYDLRASANTCPECGATIARPLHPSRLESDAT